MTADEAAAILGPELCARIDAEPVAPLSPEQIALIGRMFVAATNAHPPAADAA